MAVELSSTKGAQSLLNVTSFVMRESLPFSNILINRVEFLELE